MDIEKLKVGKRVLAKKGDITLGTGKIEQITTAPGKGTWVDVNVGDKRNPDIKRVRPAGVFAA